MVFLTLILTQIEQQNFEQRVKEIMSKKKQKLWEIQARVDSGKREVHCAKVWAKILDRSTGRQVDRSTGKRWKEMERSVTTHFCGLN